MNSKIKEPPPIQKMTFIKKLKSYELPESESCIKEEELISSSFSAKKLTTSSIGYDSYIDYYRLYCHHCKGQSIIKESEYRNNKSITCKCCNNVIDRNDIFNCVYDKDISYSTILKNVFCESIDNKIKIHLNFVLPTFFNNKVQITDYKTILVYNIDTGLSYAFRTIDKKTKKAMESPKLPKKISNITLKNVKLVIPSFSRRLRDYEFEYIASFFNEAYSKKFGFNYEIKSNNKSIEEFSIINRFPLLDNNGIFNATLGTTKYSTNSYSYSPFNDHAKSPSSKSFKRNVYKIKNTDSIQKALEKLKIPNTKKIRNLFTEGCMTDLIVFSKLFSDTNNIITATENQSKFIQIKSSIIKNKMDIRLFKNIIDATSESSFVKKILETSYRNSNQIEDCVDMFNKMLNYDKDYKIDPLMSFREMHEKLVQDSRYIKQKNLKINYKDKYKKLEHKINEFNFVLPEMTHDIIDYGDNLDICVGGAGYIDSVLRSDIAIVFLLKNNEPYVCIEIENNKIIQAKCDHNYYPVTDRDIIINWAKEKKLNYENCYDLDEKRSESYKHY